MTIHLICQGCSETLAVPDEHAGKKARCPRCQQVNLVTSNSAAPPTSLPSIESGTAQPADNPFETNASPKPLHPYPPQYGMQGGYRTPHRGGLILTFGILAFFCNFFFIPGILAWTMGSSDLKRMQAGEMDPTGHGITQAGMYLGIIATCLVAIGIIIYVVFAVLLIGAAAAGAA